MAATATPPPLTYEQLTANLSGSVRKAKLHGRDYIVANLSMLVPGVLAGSRGPLLYPLEEVAKNPDNWNNVPIVLEHPVVNGQLVSARSPDILDQYQVGFVFNAKVDGKLIAEGWFDEELLKARSYETYDRLSRGEKIELSTGVYTDDESVTGNYMGRTYTAIARNYRADHLAVILSGKGACSLEDGCGINVNQDFSGLPFDQLVANYNTVETELSFSQWLAAITANACKCGGKCDKCKKLVSTHHNDEEENSEEEEMPTPPKTNSGPCPFKVNNCGIGSGGFQPGNSCAKGGGGGGGAGKKPKASGKKAKSKVKNLTSEKSETKVGNALAKSLGHPKGRAVSVPGRRGVKQFYTSKSSVADSVKTAESMGFKKYDNPLMTDKVTSLKNAAGVRVHISDSHGTTYVKIAK